MTNEFGGRLERHHVNDYDKVQIRLDQRQINARMDVGKLTLMWMSLWLIMRT
jgi:GMP synthase-like glutamine amidotransferase